MNSKVICQAKDLVRNSGICALLNDKGMDKQIALFYLPETEQKLFAVGNWDPIGEANVMSRGIVGNVGDELVVASPLYKQHFSLLSGECLEQDASLPIYSVAIDGADVVLLSSGTT